MRCGQFGVPSILKTAFFASIVLLAFLGTVYAGPVVTCNEHSGGVVEISLGERLLLRLRDAGPYPCVTQRAKDICARLESLFTNPPANPVTFSVSKENGYVTAHCSGYKVFSVYPEDALSNNSNLFELALFWLNRVQMEFYQLRGSYQDRVIHKLEGEASWYGYKFEGNLTACGEVYDPYAFTAAHRSLLPGTLVVVSNPDNGKKVVVRINDYGPHKRGREIDLSLAAAKAIDSKEEGVATVVIEVIE